VIPWFVNSLARVPSSGGSRANTEPRMDESSQIAALEERKNFVKPARKIFLIEIIRLHSE
jgi:hypothetical protein